MLGILQIVIIKPFYRDLKIDNVSLVVDVIIDNITANDVLTNENIDEILQLTINNDACVAIFNESGKTVFKEDSLGNSCMLNYPITINDGSFIAYQDGSKLINKLNTNNSYTLEINGRINNQKMILYGEKLRTDFDDLYIFVNSPLEPVESIIEFFFNQYFILAIIVSIIALLIGTITSKKISRPIEQLQKSANKLRQGDYNTYFLMDSYSELNELAFTLNEATARLSKIEELRRDLLANVSHDIKTPLTMIQAYAEMIKDISGDNKEKREEHLDVILKEVEFLDHLILDMHDLSELQTEYTKLNKMNFNISNKILEIVKSFNVLLAKNEINLILNIENNIICYGDPNKLARVVYNFISNAIKYTKEINSNITINLFDSENTIKFEVIDNGIGISENDLPYIWDRYYKIEKNFKRNSDSTGLGLAISKAILEAHNIEFGVISKYKKGSTFYFVIDKDYINGN